MKELIERTRQDIRRYGYKTATRIKIELSSICTKEYISELLSKLECKDIKRVQYTNVFLSDFTMKDMYIYDPRKPKRKPRKTRRTTKKS